MRTAVSIALFALWGMSPGQAVAAEQVVRVADLDVSKIGQSIERPRTTGAKAAITIGGVAYDRSIPTRAASRLYIGLDGQAVVFSGLGGVGDQAKTSTLNFRGILGEVEFLVFGDGKLLAHSGPVKQGTPAAPLKANLAGVRELLLAVDGPAGAYANWVDAQITYTGSAPRTIFSPEERAVKRASSQPPEPRINGALVVGIRPGTPFLHVVAATGQRPMTFAVTGLPAGLQLDPKTGIITGVLARPGEYPVTVTARNAVGHATKTLRIVAGDQLALTPPMGWNTWNVIEGLVNETVLEEMADAIVADGLRDAGYEYIDIDDGWVVDRDSEGRPVVDPLRFPHGLKAVADYLHARGLKLGIYSSPGPTTCARYPGTLGHEETDVKTWAGWGADLMKYDRCSTPRDRERELYALMGGLLEKSGRSIVYSLGGPSAAFGAEDKAQMWRTAGDIRDQWKLAPRAGIIDCFDLQTAVAQYQHPGAWNDPDLLVVGIYGKGASSNDVGAVAGANDIEYRSQMSLWAMLSAPLLATADLRIISPSSLEMLTNTEVIDVNQDPLGREPKLCSKQGDLEVWCKDLADGSKALALLNRGEQSAMITAKWTDAGLSGQPRVRDLWRHSDIGVFGDSFTADVPRHGTVLVRVWPAK